MIGLGYSWGIDGGKRKGGGRRTIVSFQIRLGYEMR